MTWTAPDVSLPDGPLTGDDRPMLEGYLDWHRAYLQHKCAGLTGGQLAQCSVPPSNLSLLGLVRHMAKVERKWFRERIGAAQLEPMYDEATLGRDADFEDLDPSRARADYERLLEECRLASQALAQASYEDTIMARDGEMSVRAVVIHMIEEYAQHNGHADLLREALDGTTDK
ncbi:MAG: DinB family protein [Nocardioidaceae bacterium]